MKYARRYFKNAGNGRPLWFWRWTGIGPAFTPKSAEAAIFGTRQEADRVCFWLAPMRTVRAPRAAAVRAKVRDE